MREAQPTVPIEILKEKTPTQTPQSKFSSSQDARLPLSTIEPLDAAQAKLSSTAKADAKLQPPDLDQAPSRQMRATLQSKKDIHSTRDNLNESAVASVMRDITPLNHKQAMNDLTSNSTMKRTSKCKRYCSDAS